VTAGADPLELLELYQRSAVVAAACRTGIADVLAAGGGESLCPEAVAARAGTHPGATRALLGAMTALGLATRGPGGYALTEAAAVLARSHPRSLAAVVDKEWFFYRAWSELDGAVRDGHARVRPWRERLARDPLQALSFLEALDDLAAHFGGELPALAGLVEGGRLLDVGGGAGSHAAALTRAVPRLTAVVLDLAPVEAVLRRRHPELAFVAGDLEAPRFGRPVGERWDAVLLANVLHDHPPEAARRIVGEAAALVRPGGTVLVYEWALPDGGDVPAAVALFGLMMLVENEGGAAYTESQLTGWLREAGLAEVRLRRGSGPIVVLRARRP
jgi:SAM-dependent methyltransferase